MRAVGESKVGAVISAPSFRLISTRSHSAGTTGLEGRKQWNGERKAGKIFVMGKNEWRDGADWPLARAVNTRYYLHSSGTTNGLAGDGALNTTELPAKSTIGTSTIQIIRFRRSAARFAAASPPDRPEDQRPAEDRKDVLVYTTPAFTKDTEVTGPVLLDLYVSTSAVDTISLASLWMSGPTASHKT